MEEQPKQVAACSTAPEVENETKSTPHDERSTRALLSVLGAALAFFCTTGFMNSFGLFQEYYFRGPLKHKSEFDISWIGSFATFTLFLFAAPAGVVVDKIGPTIPLVIGSTGTVFAIFMISLCKEYYQFFLVQGLLLGVAMAFLICPAMVMVSKHFEKHRGLAIGIAVAGSSIGGIIWPIMINRLLNSDGVSFGWTMRIVGFTMLPLVVVASMAILPPSGSHEKQGHKTDLSIFRDKRFSTLCLGLAIFYLGMFAPFFFVTSYATSLGMSPSFSFYLVSILNGASSFGRILPGLLGDRYGHFNVCVTFALLSGIIGFCWTAVTTAAGLIVWSLAYGFASGAMMSVQAACASQLSKPETRGMAFGLVLAAGSLTGLFGSPISGQLISHGWLALSMYDGATLVVGALLIFWSRLQQNSKLLAVV